MVTFANTTGHDLLSFNFIHGILILVLGIQILKDYTGRLHSSQVPNMRADANSELQSQDVNTHFLAGNEGHEDIITDCGGGNIRAWRVKLRVPKFLPVLK